MSLKDKIRSFMYQTGSDAQAKSVEVKGQGINICIACFPKSGSTYLSKLLAAYTGFQREDYVHAWGRREQEWEKAIVEKLSTKNVIIQQHTRGSDATLKLIGQFKIRQIVLVRNIYDIIPSIKDHLSRESFESPAMYADQSHLSMPDEKLFDMIIDLMIPWYINFYTTWFFQCKKHGIPIISYEEFFSDQDKQFQRLCGLLKLEYKEDKYMEARAVVKNEQTRFNVGKQGRGIVALSETQKERIRKFASYYPECNFSLIGIR